jgi:hypothetical protein
LIEKVRTYLKDYDTTDGILNPIETKFTLERIKKEEHNLGYG